MSCFEKLKSWLRRRAVAGNRKRHARDRKYCSIGDAQRVAIVFKMHEGAVPGEVKALAKSCAARHQQCTLIGYCDADELPHTFVGNKHCAVFTRKALNWYSRPLSDDVDRFVRSHFDILIDCCREADVYPLQYVVAAAQASLLVGGVLYPHCPYDIIIDAQQTCSLGEYIEQVLHYLTTIEAKPDAAPPAKETEEKVGKAWKAAAKKSK